jgi:hypothetical protein
MNAAISAACAMYPTLRSSTSSTESVSVLIHVTLADPTMNALVYRGPDAG